MKSVAVYCGSSSGTDAFIEAARATGRHLAESDITLIYGGGAVGLMGTIADAALEAGGKVIGVIPEFLKTKELGHNGLTELIVVENMHQRKQKMIDLSEGFIALPGGFGTMEELFEVLAWNQLSLHPHPCGLLNVEDYYTGLLACLDGMVDTSLLRQEDRNRLSVDTSPESLLETMREWTPPATEKWI